MLRELIAVVEITLVRAAVVVGPLARVGMRAMVIGTPVVVMAVICPPPVAALVRTIVLGMVSVHVVIAAGMVVTLFHIAAAFTRVAPIFDTRSVHLGTKLGPKGGMEVPHAATEMPHPSEVPAETATEMPTTEMPAAEPARIRARGERHRADGNTCRQRQSRLENHLSLRS